MTSNQTEVSNIIEENFYDIDYVVDVITKEAPKEQKLAKKVLCTILSAKSNDPINLAVNAPTGLGKSYVVLKVADLFPKKDIVSLGRMSEKALFHREGLLVIKDDDGNYVLLEQKIKDIDLQIQIYHNEIERTNDNNLKQARKEEIKDLEDQKEELKKHSKKLIGLTGMTRPDLYYSTNLAAVLYYITI